MKNPKFLHPANAEELANIAQETGAEVLRGALRYPSETGNWQLGDVDLGEYFAKFRDCELVLVVAAVGQASERLIACGICGFALDEIGECPRCKMQIEEDAKGIRERQELRRRLFEEVDDILLGRDEVE